MDFTKKELVGMLETIGAAGVCADGAKLTRLIMDVKEIIGAEYCACGLGLTSGGLSDKIMPVNGNYPDKWIEAYVSEKLFRKDPVIKYQLRHTATCLWSDALKAFNDDETKNFMRLARGFGLDNGITASIADPAEGIISVFSFAGTKVEGIRNKWIINALAPHLHSAIARAYKAPAVNGYPC